MRFQWTVQAIQTLSLRHQPTRFLSDPIQMSNQGLVEVADYGAMLASPAALGSGQGSGDINSNFAALAAYQGAFTKNTRAFKGMKNLGPSSSGLVGTRGFINTGGNCADSKSGKSVPRYDYFNGATTGGLLGGLTKDVSTMMDGLLSMTSGIGGPAEPKCTAPQLSVISKDGIASSAAYHIPNARLCQLDPSVFIQPQARRKICDAEGFSNRIPDDFLSRAYIGGIGLLIVYIGVKLVSRKRSRRA